METPEDYVAAGPMSDKEATDMGRHPGTFPEMIRSVHKAGVEEGLDDCEDSVECLQARVKELEEAADEQARLLGMSGSRELQHLTRIRELEREVEAREWLTDVEKQNRENDKNPPEVRLNVDLSLDEVVGTGRFHLEQMSNKHWWLCITGNGKRVDVNLSSKAKITATFSEFREEPPKESP